MTEIKRPLKVFLCHAHSDKNVVRSLYSRLKREGVDVWLDKEKLLPGADWEFEIRKAVREADVVVVCLSKEFNQAGFRQKEVRIALDAAMHQPDGGIFIIPARLEECENLESLNKWHWVDLYEEGGYQNLIRALRARGDRIGATLRMRRRGKPIVSLPIDEDPEKAEQDRLTKATHEKQEREVAEKNAREKAEKEAVEKAGLDTEEQARIKASKEKAEREAAEKVAQEKVRLEAEEQARQIAAKEEERTKYTKPPRKLSTIFAIVLIGFVGTIVAALFGPPLIEKWFSPAPVATETATATVTMPASLTPSRTITPTRTPTLTPTITLTPTVTSTTTNTPPPPCSGGNIAGVWSGYVIDRNQQRNSVSMSLSQVGCKVSGIFFRVYGHSSINGSVSNGVFYFDSEVGLWCYKSGTLNIDGNSMIGRTNGDCPIVLNR